MRARDRFYFDQPSSPPRRLIDQIDSASRRQCCAEFGYAVEVRRAESGEGAPVVLLGLTGSGRTLVILATMSASTVDFPAPVSPTIRVTYYFGIQPVQSQSIALT